MKTKLLLVMICGFLLPSSGYAQSYNLIGYSGGITTSLLSSGTGSYNAAFGQYALPAVGYGSSNSAFGQGALEQLVGTSDGLTANYNSAFGQGALFANIDGIGNSAFGAFALYNATSSTNCAFGLESLYDNVSGEGNNAFGYESMAHNTGANNSAIGYQVMFSNGAGGSNSALGFQSLYSNGDGNSNVAIGSYSLYNNTTANMNVALGDSALANNTTGEDNVAVGFQALTNNTEGSDNTAVGYQALYTNNTLDGNQLVALGYGAGYKTNDAFQSTFVGYNTGYSNTTGSNNTYLGTEAAYSNDVGSENTIVGEETYEDNVGGNENTVVGRQAGRNVTGGDFNTLLGYRADLDNTDPSSNNYNTIIGWLAGYTTDNDYNTFVGCVAGVNNNRVDDLGGEYNTALGGNTDIAGGLTNATAIGYNADVNTDNTIVLGSDGLIHSGSFPHTTAVTEIAFNGALAPSTSPGSYDPGTAGYFLESLGSGVPPRWVNPPSGIAGAWYLTGNSGTTPGTNFLGTTDDNALEFKTNNTFSGVIDPDAGNGSVFLGVSAGNYGPLSGSSLSVGIGYQALYNNDDAVNCAIGYQALYGNSDGEGNNAVGYQALYYNTQGDLNCGMGYNALYYNELGQSNTAFGSEALNGTYSTSSNINNNTAVGYQALYLNQVDNNNALGYLALYSNTTGTPNDAFGFQALTANQGGSYNDAFGYNALSSNVSGNDNVAVGYQAGLNTDVGDNTFIGYNAGMTNQSSSGGGNENTCLGSGADVSTTGLTDATAIGFDAVVNASYTMQLGDNFLTTLFAGSHMIYPSDGNYKRNINQNVIGLNFINKLKPVTYNLDVESLDEHVHGGKVNHSERDLEAMKLKDEIVYSGFIAQDVETAAKSVGYNFSGIHTPQTKKDIYGLAYSDFVVPLVKSVQELSAKSDSKDSIISQLQQQLATQSNQIEALQSANSASQIQLDQLSAIVSKLDIALSQCCTNYQSTTTNSSVIGSNTTNAPLLNQNIPNPFSQNSIISCYVPTTAKGASIIIYSLDGVILKSFTIGNTGFNQITITGGTLAAGDYLYTLFVDGQKIDTKKMTLTH